jgi:hypothetical protein
MTDMLFRNVIKQGPIAPLNHDRYAAPKRLSTYTHTLCNNPEEQISQIKFRENPSYGLINDTRPQAGGHLQIRRSFITS